jgi:hemerythrin superfamily protein
MIYELGKELQTTDFTDEHVTDVMVSRLKEDLSSASSACVICLLHQHAGLEDDYVFPDVRKFEPKMVDTLLEEHREVVRRIAGVWKIADEVKTLRDPEKRTEVGAKLNRTANDLFAFYLTHLSNEESTLVPAMWKHFTDEQILAMQRRVIGSLTAERATQWNSWLFPSLNINELTSMFMGLKKGAPAPVFQNMTRIAEKTLGEDRWVALKAKAGL